jgi:EspA/EspE family
MEAISERAGLVNLREVGEWLKGGRRTPDERTRDIAELTADVVGSDVLDLGQMLIAAMKRTTGEGEPDTGAKFGHAHSAFNKAGETFQSAGPDDRWDGSASRAYADQTTRQQLRTGTMADADLEVHRVLFREAAQITLRRGFLDDWSNFLAYTSYATFPLQFIKTWGEAAKLAVEIKAVELALAVSAQNLYELHSEAGANATELQQAIGRYRSVVDGAEMPGVDVDYSPPPALPGLSDTVPAEPPSSSVGVTTPGGAPGVAPAAGGVDAAPGAAVAPLIPGPTIAGPTPVAELPPAPQAAPMAPPLGTAPVAAAAPLGALISQLTGLITSAVLLAAQQAAASAQAGQPEVATDHPDGDERPSDKEDDEDKKDERAEDASAAAGGGHAERAPVERETDSERDRPHAPLAVRLGPDTSPGPPAGMSPQNMNKGDEIDVRR